MLTQDKEDMKIVKFKNKARELHDYLKCLGKFSSEASYLDQDTYGFPLIGWLVGRSTSYQEKYIYKPSFLEEGMQDNQYLSVLRNIIVTSGQHAVGFFLNPKQIISNAEDVINAFSSCKTIGDHRDDNPNSEIADYYELVFWLLFTAAIDDNIYNNSLSDIIDLAYCLEFNEEMINDWCKAIEFVLNGNQLCEEECNLKLDTKEGRWFFFHDKGAFLGVDRIILHKI